MDVQDQNEVMNLSTIITRSNQMCSDNDGQAVTAAHLKDMYTTGDDNMPKARKPYTITKQRERWTEEEHKKFLEALKLYGRAWRRIEEHVGSKTAVQIRSHAQKFFSKVVKETNTTEASPVKAIEIPPPRPKRKPMHPYPRKQVQPINKRLSESQERSPSPNSSVSEHENQSPKSVLSAVGSDTLGSTSSNNRNGSQSPISSADATKPVNFLLSGKENRCRPSTSLTEDENGSPSTVATSLSIAEEQSLMKFDVGSKDHALKAESVETPTMSLKLFGRTVLITDSHRPSSPPTVTGKPVASESQQESLDTNEAEPVQKVVDNTCSMGSSRSAWSSWPQRNPSMFYQMQVDKGNPIAVEGASGVSMPWWRLQGGPPFPLFPTFEPNSVSVQTPPEACYREVSEDMGVQDKEGSSTGSSTSEVGTSDKSGDVAESDNQETLTQGFVLKPSIRSAFSPLRANPNKCIKGFVPYKRCLAEREEQSSMIVAEERDGQRIRLCL